MKPFIRALLFSFISLTLSTNVNAAVQHSSSTDTIDIFYGPVSFSQQANLLITWHTAYKNLPQDQWESSTAYQNSRAFCLNNPLFQWIENGQKNLLDKEEQCVQNFLHATKSGIWENKQHRINGFIELIIFLYERIAAYNKLIILDQAAHEASSHSPKLKAAKHDEFKDQDVDNLIEEVFDDYTNKKAAALSAALDQEWNFLHSQYSENNWGAFIKNIFMSPFSHIQKTNIGVFSQQAEKILTRIFKDDPTFK